MHLRVAAATSVALVVVLGGAGCNAKSRARDDTGGSGSSSGGGGGSGSGSGGDSGAMARPGGSPDSSGGSGGSGSGSSSGAMARPGGSPDGGTITSPLPEQGPHPDYPTPRASGTDKLFTLEDPDRGATVAPTFDLAAVTRGALVWTKHAHCVADTVDMICSPPGRGAVVWRVGRRGREVVVAVPQVPVEHTHVYLAKADGTPLRYIEIDRYQRVASASTFAGDRYANRLPKGSNGLAGCGSMAFTLDRRRRAARVRCLQWSGDPMHDTRGVGATRYVRDGHGFVRERHHEDTAGRPVANTDRVAIEKHELDGAGRTTLVRYRDVHDRPVQSATGCHGHRYDRHADGGLRTLTCLDATDAPTAASTGIASNRYVVDARGCRTSWRYADARGEAKAGGSNIHGIDLVVDARCSELERTCLDIVEQPVACGVALPATYKMVRDATGRITSTKHVGTDGKPAGDAQYQAFELRYQYDPLGNRTGESCYGADGKPILCGTTGFHAKRTTYDGAGRIVEDRFYDTAGAPTTNLGTAVRKFQYDNYDHIYERRSADATGAPIESMGQTTRRDLYDETHRAFAVIMLDQAGQPATYTGCYTGTTCPETGWHAVRIVRRADGTVSKNQFFDRAGQLIDTMDCRRVRCFE